MELVGRLDTCLLASYAVDPVRAAALLPDGLEPATCRGAAFLSVAVCHVDRMRPRFVPPPFGVSFWSVAFRLLVRACPSGGAALEGYYFLRSDVDRRSIGRLGNLVTDFRFNAAAIEMVDEGRSWRLRTEDGDGVSTASFADGETSRLACDPPFASVGERERVLRYSTLGLAVSRSGRAIRVVEVVRDPATWRESPLGVARAEWAFVRHAGFAEARLVRATRVAPTDYVWRIGRVERRG